jgi:hypothetical protein
MKEHLNYIQIPGNKTHELPPLVVASTVETGDQRGFDLASVMVEAEEMLPDVDADAEIIEQRKFDLATSLTEQYRGIIVRWKCGDSILEWIRQCEITFESESALRNLLHPDVWPHAARSSFVTLLVDKAVALPGFGPRQAVGLRLTFRQPPPIHCCSDQFLFYLNSSVADSAYQAWAHLSAEPTALLPPDRFHFDVLDLDRA